MLSRRVVHLDSQGAGILVVGPSRFAGCSPPNLTVTNRGHTFPSDPLPNEMPFAEGAVTVEGGEPYGEAALHFENLTAGGQDFNVRFGHQPSLEIGEDYMLSTDHGDPDADGATHFWEFADTLEGPWEVRDADFEYVTDSLRPTDSGRYVRARVSAYRIWGDPALESSFHETVAYSVVVGPLGEVPPLAEFAHAPVIGGAPVVGNTLTIVSNGDVTGVPTPSLYYEWWTFDGAQFSTGPITGGLNDPGGLIRGAPGYPDTPGKFVFLVIRAQSVRGEIFSERSNTLGPVTE